jgi:hypothetical protein
VHAADLALPGEAVGRGAVVERAAAAGEVELGVDHVVPEPREDLLELLVARLGHEVGEAGIEVVGPHGVAGGDRLLAHREAVLVVVAAVEVVAHVDERLGEAQVPLVARCAVQLHHAHVVRGADRAGGELLRVLGGERLEEPGGALRRVEQHGAAGDSVMADADRDEVPEVVGLEVEAVGQCPDLLPVALGDEGGRVQVAVVALHGGDLGGDRVDLRLELGIGRRLEDADGGLEPLVEVAVEEGRALMHALGVAGRDEEVAPTRADLGVAQRAPDRRHRHVAGPLELGAPEAPVPSKARRAERRQRRMSARGRGDGHGSSLSLRSPTMGNGCIEPCAPSSA